MAELRHTTPEYRARIENLIERLIEQLDSSDGDPDLEPYLAGFEVACADDREVGDDDEFSLGWSELWSLRGVGLDGWTDFDQMDA